MKQSTSSHSGDDCIFRTNGLRKLIKTKSYLLRVWMRYFEPLMISFRIKAVAWLPLLSEIREVHHFQQDPFRTRTTTCSAFLSFWTIVAAAVRWANSICEHTITEHAACRTPHIYYATLFHCWRASLCACSTSTYTVVAYGALPPTTYRKTRRGLGVKKIICVVNGIPESQNDVQTVVVRPGSDLRGWAKVSH